MAHVWKDGYCRWHHPDLEERRAAERREGGRARANARRARKELQQSAMTLKEIDGLLCRSMVQVARGDMSPGVASALGTLARSVIAVRDAGEITERLERVEAAIIEREGA